MKFMKVNFAQRYTSYPEDGLAVAKVSELYLRLSLSSRNFLRYGAMLI